MRETETKQRTLDTSQRKTHDRNENQDSPFTPLSISPCPFSSSGTAVLGSNGGNEGENAGGTGSLFGVVDGPPVARGVDLADGPATLRANRSTVCCGKVLFLAHISIIFLAFSLPSTQTPPLPSPPIPSTQLSTTASNLSSVFPAFPLPFSLSFCSPLAMASNI